MEQWCSPRGDRSGEVFSCSDLGAIGTECVETRGAAGHPTVAGRSCSQEARLKGPECVQLVAHVPCGPPWPHMLLGPLFPVRRLALCSALTPASAPEAETRSTSPLPAKQARLEWPLHLLGPSMALAPGGACPDPSLHAATSVPPRVLSRASGHWTRESCLPSALGGL